MIHFICISSNSEFHTFFMSNFYFTTSWLLTIVDWLFRFLDDPPFFSFLLLSNDLLLSRSSNTGSTGSLYMVFFSGVLENSYIVDLFSYSIWDVCYSVIDLSYIFLFLLVFLNWITCWLDYVHPIAVLC